MKGTRAPRVGTTGTAGPWNLIPVISLNGDIARSVMVLVRTICSRVADLGPIGGLARGTHRALSRTRHPVRRKTSPKGSSGSVRAISAGFSTTRSDRCAKRKAGFRTGSNSATPRRPVPARVLVRRTCFTATLRLKHSQERYAEQLERERRARSKLKNADKHQVPGTRRTRHTD